MSLTLSLPTRLLSQTSRQITSTQCLRQRAGYIPLANTSNKQQWQWQHPSKRTFATTPRPRAQQRPAMKQPAQPSITRQQKEQQAAMLRKGEVPDDVGLLQDTFVLPRNPSERWSLKLRRKWLRSRFTDFYGALAFKWMLVKPRPKLEISKIAPRAAELHSEMYKAFAVGDLNPVSDKVCSGLFGSLRGRLMNRAPNTFLKWDIKRQVEKPKLCSYKAAVLPGPQGESSEERNAQIQAVVKLHTVQSLQHVKKVQKREGNSRKLVTVLENVGAEEEKESVEYVVIQRTIRRGKLNPWQIWGFTEETSLAKIEQEEREKQ